MKKLVSVSLCLLLVLSMTAVAETAETTETVAAEKIVAEETTEAAEVTDGMEYTISMTDGVTYVFTLPSGWEENEAAEDSENPSAFAAISETGSAFTMNVYETEESYDAQSLCEAYAASYADAAVVTLNGTDFVRYTDTDINAIVIAYADGTSLTEFAFTPADNADTVAEAETIISTLTRTAA